MQPLKTHHGKVIPLAMDNIDTDMIIPAQYLTSTSRQGFGTYLFQRLKTQNPQFAFNQLQYQNASILVTQANFGCGSSREHAVWALQEAGIKVVIASSFADIFTNNAKKNGLLLVSLPAQQISELLTACAAGDCFVTVDVANAQLSLATNEKIAFAIDPFFQYCLLEGLDELDYLLSHTAEIDTYSPP